VWHLLPVSTYPYHFRFVDTSIDFMGQPLISVHDTIMDRDGWRLTSYSEHYTELQFLLCQYLDFVAKVDGRSGRGGTQQRDQRYSH